VTEQPTLDFAGLLRQLRGRTRLTQEELAEAAGLSLRAVSDLERGIHRTARKDTAVLLADALGVAGPAHELFVAAARGRGDPGQVLAAGDAGQVLAAGDAGQVLAAVGSGNVQAAGADPQRDRPGLVSPAARRGRPNPGGSERQHRAAGRTAGRRRPRAAAHRDGRRGIRGRIRRGTCHDFGREPYFSAR